MSAFINLIGQKYGRLKVLSFCGRLNKHSMFRCICDCGNMVVATSNNLRRNHTTSCGCANNERCANINKTHGLSNHPLYESWIGMRNRCYYGSHNRFEYYGGKGIGVCDEWVDNFMAFYTWAKKNGWKRGLQVDRIDNGKNYCPENCRFSTIKQQSRNRTSNVKLTINGETKILQEWSELSGLNPTTIKSRIKRGWSFENAVYKPLL